MAKRSPIVFTVKFTPGSDWQESFGLESMNGLLVSWQTWMLARHKKNKVDIKVERLDDEN